jgi:hypothetical protein
VRRGGGTHRGFDRLADAPARGIVDRDRHAHPRRQPADVHAPRGAGAGRQRRASAQTRLEADVLGELVGPQQLQQPKEAVGVVFERRRAEQQHVPAERGDRGHGAPRGFAGMSGRAPQALRFVHHQQIDARLDRCAVNRGSAVSVSSAITARRCSSKG